MPDQDYRENQGLHGPLPNSGPVYERFPPPRSRLTLERVIRFLLGAGIVLVVAWLIWYFAALIVYLIVGIVLAYLMKPIVDRLQGLGIGRIPSILVTFLFVFGALILLITKLVPFASEQIQDISNQVSFQSAAQVTAVDPDGPAEDAGIASGDAILEVEGSTWDGFSQLQSVLHGKAAGDSLRVQVELQSGERETRYIPIRRARPGAESTPIVTDEEDERYIASLGLTAQEVTMSNVAVAIERRVRAFVPVKRGAIIDGIAAGLQKVFGQDQITLLAESIFGVFTNIFYAVLVIPFVAFFFLKDGSKIRHNLLRLAPNRYFELTLMLMEKIETNIGRYFRGLSLQILAVAAVASVLLSIVGLEYSIAVGVFTGLANTIPYFGPIMGFLAGTLLGVVQTGDFSLVPGVTIAMLLTQAADNLIFQPYIFARAARTHPLLILFAVLIGAQLAGIVGMLLAIPVLTILRVTIEQLLWSLRNYRILKTA